MLYKDAQQRKERHRSRVDSEISNSRKRANSKHRSQDRNANKFLINNILKRLNESCRKKGVTVNRAISYHEMIKIFYTMGYICDNITEYEKLLLDNMFQSINNSDNTTLYIKNLFAFLLAIHGIPTKEKFVFYGANEEQYSTLKECTTMAEEDDSINIQYDHEQTVEKMQPYGILSK